MEDDFVVRMPDVRAAFNCSRGAREFAHRHNLSWDRFLEEGILASELVATGDQLAIDMVEALRGRQQ